MLLPQTTTLQFSFTEGVPNGIAQQYNNNLRWLREAEKHKMVVGSQARILYSDQVGRVQIALAFNNAVKNGAIKVCFSGYIFNNGISGKIGIPL